MSKPADSVYVAAEGGRFERLKLSDLLFVEADDGWVRLVLKPHSYRLQTNLGTIEAQLPSDRFLRVSRQHIVNLSRIECYETGFLWLEGGHKLPIGPQFRQPLLTALPVLRTKLPARP